MVRLENIILKNIALKNGFSESKPEAGFAGRSHDSTPPA
jgi:hypothetical protein